MLSAAFITPITPIPRAPKLTTRVHRAPKMTSPNDLLVIGAGALGSRVARLWRATHPSAQIIAETRTESSHPALKSFNITPNLAGIPTHPFPNIVFCVPTHAIPEYAEAVTAATKRVLPNGRFVFTSSAAVYGDISFATERTPTTDKGRAKKVFHAEKAVLAIPQGIVVRMPGLYDLESCPATHWFRQGYVPESENTEYNFIHYDDAADIVVRALSMRDLTERVFLATAQRGMSKRDYIEAALRHPRYKGTPIPPFLNDKPKELRNYDNSLTRRTLGWKPRFETFLDFIEEQLRTQEDLSVGVNS